MEYFAGYLGVLALSAVAGQALFHATRWMFTGQPPAVVTTLVDRFRPPAPEPEPMPPVLDELELTRLAHELAAVRESDRQGLALRITACTIAYDEALLRCCESHGLPAPTGRKPLSTSQRLEAECSLMAAGVSW